jgi:hypothetical protein
MAFPRLSLVVAALLACIFQIQAQTDGSFGFRKLASWPGFVRGTPSDILILDNFAYIAMGEGGLCIVDVTSRSNPTVVSRLDLPGSAQRLRLHSDDLQHLYVVCGGAGLQIVNISNPAAPVLAGSYDTDGSALGFSMAPPYGFIADGPNGVTIVDLSNISSPKLAGQIQLPTTTYDVTAELVVRTINQDPTPVTNRFLQVVNGTNGFLAFDVTDPSAPVQRVHETNPGWDARSMFRYGRYVYWMERGFLSRRDYLAPPSALSEFVMLIDPFSQSRPVSKFFMAGSSSIAPSRVYLFSGSESYTLPYSPAGQYTATLRAYPETALGDTQDGYLYCLDVRRGLTIYQNGILVSATPIGGNALRIELAGDRVYVADGQQGLQVLTTASDGSLTSQGRYWNGHFPTTFDVVGSNVFMWAGTNVEILDVSDATQPFLLTNVAPMLTNRPTDLIQGDIVVKEGFAYISSRTVAFSVLNVSDPAKPVYVRKSTINNLSLYSMNFVGTNIFATEVRGIASIAVNPDKGASVRQSLVISTQTGRSMKVAGNLAYFCDRANGLKIYDISDPANMSLVGTYDTPGNVFDVAISGSFAYVADQFDGVLVLDVSNPSNPTLVATLPLSNSPLDIEVRGNRLFVAHGVEGVSVWDLVPRQAQSINFPAISDKTAIDQPFAISATASSGLPVEFAVLSGPATVQNGNVTITGAGTVTIRASQPGNDEFGAVFADRTFNVSKAAQTINFPAIAEKTTRSAPFEITATANSGFPVKIYILSGPASFDGFFATNNATVTITGAGVVTIRATQSGNNDWAAATVDRTFTVIEAMRDSQIISMPSPSAASVDDEPLQFPITASSGLPVDVTISGPATLDGGILTFTGMGGVTITASQAGDRDFAPATLTRTFTVYDLPGAATASVIARNPSLPSSATLPEADPDSDGLPNIVEYILRSDPTSATSMEGHITGTLFESGGARYLKARYFKPRTLRYPVGIQVADFAEYPNLTWLSLPVGFNDQGTGDFLWPLNGTYQSPLIRFFVRYP